MNKIFSYTMQYSGSRFLNNIFRQNYEFDFIGDYHLKRLGRPYAHISLDLLACNKIDNLWWDSTISKYYNTNNKNILFHAHNYHKDSSILKSIKKNKPTIPVITTIRDPLLISNTSIWTRYALYNKNILYESKEIRIKHIKEITERLELLLSLPLFDYIYPLFIDSTLKYKDQINKLLYFCNINNIKDISLKPIGETKTTKKLYTKKEGNTFNIIKDAIINKDKKTVNKYLNVELDYLKTCYTLKDKLVEYKYDLLW